MSPARGGETIASLNISEMNSERSSNYFSSGVWIALIDNLHPPSAPWQGSKKNGDPVVDLIMQLRTSKNLGQF